MKKDKRFKKLSPYGKLSIQLRTLEIPSRLWGHTVGDTHEPSRRNKGIEKEREKKV